MAEPITVEEVGTGPNGCSHRRMELIADAIEGVLTNAQVLTALSNAIDAATSPVVLTNVQKRRAVLMWAKMKIEEVT